MKITDSIYIEASPGVVWRVSQDVERWPEWTPTVISVALLTPAPFRLGSVARIRQPLQPEANWTVVEFDEGRRFAWSTQRTGLQLLGRHEMLPQGAGTRNVLTVEARGTLAVLLWAVLRPAMRRALAEENRGLKARCETDTKSALTAE